MARIAIVTGGNPRHRCGDFQGAEGGRLYASSPIMPAMTRRRRSSRPRPASMCANGMSATTPLARAISRRSKTRSARSICSSTMPASPRDAMFHKMTPEQWYQVINTNLNSLFNMTRPLWDGMRARELRPHHLHLLDQRPEGPDGPGQLLGRQGRRYRLRQGTGAGRCRQGHHRQCDLPRLYRHRNGAGRAEGGA